MSGKATKSLTVRYMLLNMAYFAGFCAVHAYAAVFLLANGFNNTEVGILLAVANILSAILQPVVAGIIDKKGVLTNRNFIMISVLVILSGSLLLLFVPGNKAFIFVIYALIFMIQFVYQPVMTALSFEYQKAGCDIYYGLARGMGSAAFAVTSLFLGRLISGNGVDAILWAAVIAMVASLILIFMFRPLRRNQNPEDRVAETNQEETKQSHKGGFISFMRTYPAFSLFIVAIICFFFSHNMIGDFMIQIVRHLGGTETEMGYSNFLQAILELPVMALIGIVLKKFSADKLLVFSGAAFFVKIMILVFATGMVHMYISQSFQLFAYAVFIPAGAYYVSDTMEEADQVKGQAFITSAITIGGVFSNMISGVILDNFSIRTMLVTGSIVCGIGVVIGFIAMNRLPHHSNS